MTIFNTDYLNIQRTYLKLNQKYQQLQTQYTTGNRVNSAKDDAAALSVSERLKAQLNGYTVGLQNLMDAKSVAEIVQDTYGNVSDILKQMKTLAVQYQSSTTSSADKTAIKENLTKLQTQIQDQLNGLTYNNKNITSDINGKLKLTELGDMVKVKNNDTLKVQGTAITMEATVNLDSYSSGDTGEDRGLVLAKGGNYYLTVNRSGKVAIYKEGTTPSKTYYNSVGKVNLGEDTTITGVFEDNIAKIYINGKLDSTFTLTTGGYADKDIDLRFGRENDVGAGGYSRQVYGTIDNARIYSRALSDAEVSDNYNGNVSRNQLIGEWLFDDGEFSTTVADTSGNNNFGNMFKNTQIVTTGEGNMNFNSGAGDLTMSFASLSLNKLGIEDLSTIPSDLTDRLDRAIDLVSKQQSTAGAFVNKINFRIQNNQKLAANYEDSLNKIQAIDLSNVSSELTKVEMQQATIMKMLKLRQDTDAEIVNMLIS
jgi:flagellin